MPDPYWPKRRIGLDDNVWHGICKATGEEVVMKLFERESFSDGPIRDEKVLTEVKILKDLSRTYPSRIIQFIDFYANDENQLVLVMERADCTLQDILYERNYLAEDDAREAIFGMLEGAACVHMSSLVHRDIKPANLMLMDKNDFSTVKIADFGTTVGNVGYENLNQIAGTLGYEAPEMLTRSYYGKPVDIWSCGIVAYQLLVGCLPFKASPSTGLFSTKKIGPKQQYDAIKRGLEAGLTFASPHGNVVISEPAKHLVRSLLQLDPANRLTVQEALEHPWFGHNAREPVDQNRNIDSLADSTVEPLPECPGWMIVSQKDGSVYYYNKKTLETSWDPPAPNEPPMLPTRPSGKGFANIAEQAMRKQAQSQVEQNAPSAVTAAEGSLNEDPIDAVAEELPVPDYPNWYTINSKDGVYYYNAATRETSWDLPSTAVGPNGPDIKIEVEDANVQPKSSAQAKKAKRVQFGDVVTEVTRPAVQQTAPPIPPKGTGFSLRRPDEEKAGGAGAVVDRERERARRNETIAKMYKEAPEPPGRPDQYREVVHQVEAKAEKYKDKFLKLASNTKDVIKDHYQHYQKPLPNPARRNEAVDRQTPAREAAVAAEPVSARAAPPVPPRKEKAASTAPDAEVAKLWRNIVRGGFLEGEQTANGKLGHVRSASSPSFTREGGLSDSANGPSPSVRALAARFDGMRS